MTRKAFTLIELLIVVTILAILIALILPAIQSVRGRSNEAYCVNNLKQLYMAAMMYADDNDGNLPPTVWLDPPPGRSMREVLANYIPDEDGHYTCLSNPLKDVYLSSATYGYSCYAPAFEDYPKWERDGSRLWDSSARYETMGGSLIFEWVDDSGSAPHRNKEFGKFGLHVTTKGAFYFWYIPGGAWAEYPSGRDAPLR